MNRETVGLDLAARGFTGYALLTDPRGKSNIVVLAEGSGVWATFLQDERAQVLRPSLREFAHEEEALADFVHRVELWNRITGVR
ncbi:hypothetical protein [Microbacterium panaciterrae]|uniref:Transposase n=1 Tax=Microbacterium panaciterrae TaxID=985759 RepID=A0ABP8P5C7_9MICO